MKAVRWQLRGRERELSLLRAAIAEASTSFSVFYVHGLGGVGKTALLDACLEEAAAAGLPTASLDGRSIDASPREFLGALADGLGLAEGESPLEHLPRKPAVVAIDSYDSLAPLDLWLRRTFLSRLERGVLVVAGRSQPGVDWVTDPTIGASLRIVPLGNLGMADSRALLSDRNVPEDQQAAVLQFTHGHPLALVLVGDVAAAAGTGEIFRPQDAPQVVHDLLRRLIEAAPTLRHRTALETCARVRATTEALLAAVIEDDDVHEIFEWLRGLSFIEQRAEGLLPHDIVREVLDADLRWRDPDGYVNLHRRVLRHLRDKLVATSGRARQRVFFDKMFLHRASAAQYHDHASLGTVYAQSATAVDHQDIIDAVRAHEGDRSARIAAFWLDRQPHAFRIARGPDDELLGVVATLFLDDPAAPEVEVDPAVRAAWAFTRRVGPIREGEAIAHHRFHMSCRDYQQMSVISNLLAMAASFAPLEHPRLALSFLPFADPARWIPLMRYVDFVSADDASFVVNGRQHGVFAHDWRAEPFDAWWDAMGERSIATEPGEDQELGRSPLLALAVLSAPEFERSVREALRDYARPDALAANPLIRSRLALATTGHSGGPAALQSILQEALETLKAHPRDQKFYRALAYTYFQPAATQESAAERLGLPFSTYRYHLARGIDRIVEWLWNMELRGGRAGSGATTHP